MTTEVDEEFLFEGLKVLDVGTWIAAPVATTILADLGATVIKIEQPEVGDAYRNFALLPSSPTADINYSWAVDNRNKRSLALNLKTEPGMALLKRLVEDCDVYVTNQPQSMRRALGLMYEDLRELNPRMIYASLTAYGEDGPEKDREGFDLVAYWARSGLMDSVRAIGAPPSQSLPGMGDHPTAVTMYANIVTALLRRERTGKGAKVHTSLLANGLWSATTVAQAVFTDADFSTHRHPDKAPFSRDLYETSDGIWLQFTMVRTVEQFDQLMVALEMIDVLADERFLTPELRFENGGALIPLFKQKIAQRTAEDWMALFEEAGVPASRMETLQDLATDQQVQINGMTMTPVEDIGVDRMIKDPLNIDGLRRVGAKKAPDIGEHSDEVLREMGHSDAEIAQLREQGVI